MRQAIFEHRRHFACRDCDNVIIKCDISKYECHEQKHNLCVSTKKGSMAVLVQSTFTGRRGMGRGMDSPLGPVMVNASMCDTIIECFHYYYVGYSTTVETLDRN